MEERGYCCHADVQFTFASFFGRAEDYEKLTQTLDEAQQAFSAGNRNLGLAKTLDVFKQANNLTMKIAGPLSPAPYTSLPTNPGEALEFVTKASEIVHNYAVDGKGMVVALAGTGDAMEDGKCPYSSRVLEEANRRKQIAVLQKCMSYGPQAAKPAAQPGGDGGYRAQREALLNRAQADQKAMNACIKVQNTCNLACNNQPFACNTACNGERIGAWLP